jgi:hypothetical protein
MNPVAELVVSTDATSSVHEVTRCVDVTHAPSSGICGSRHDQVDRQPERTQQQRVVAERGDVTGKSMGRFGPGGTFVDDAPTARTL